MLYRSGHVANKKLTKRNTWGQRRVEPAVAARSVAQACFGSAALWRPGELARPTRRNSTRGLQEAYRDLVAWITKWQGKYPKLVDWVESSIGET